MNDNKRIAYNTAYTYIRLLLTLSVSLFSTKYILLALGDVDYGIYNVVAGVVALFTFISSTLATTTQRFISFSLGKYNEVNKVKEIIFHSFVLHIVIAIIVTILVLIGGRWAISNILDIPFNKLSDANFVLYTVSVGLFATICGVPLDAILMAKENILFISVINTTSSVLKFIIAVLLLYINSDRLCLYALLIASISYIDLIGKWVYCNKKIEEFRIKIHKINNFSILKEMGSFAGWIMIGTTCSTIRQQGSSILLNIFFGVVINAATGIATQVYGVLMQFTSSIVSTMRPQLVKSAGAKDQNRMTTLTYAVCKYPLLLAGLAAIPLIISMPYVLEIWLENVPPYTTAFCQLLLIAALLNQSTIGLTISLEAYGKIKQIHTVIGSTFMLVLPIGYILLKCGYSPPIIYICIMLNEAIASVLRVYFAEKLLGLTPQDYLNNVFYPFLRIIIPIFLLDSILWNYFNHNTIALLIFFFISSSLYFLFTYLFGLSYYEKDKVKRPFSSIINHLKR